MIPKHFIFFALVASCAITLASCGDKEDITNTVDHSGSIETSIAVRHLDSTRDVVLTTHKIWTKGEVSGTIIHRDTIPGLGTITTEAGNNDSTKTVTVPKDYQIFITMQ
jgi:hypothetical protein